MSETDAVSKERIPRSRGADLTARYRRRRQNGMRCVVIELREAEIDVLIRRRWLESERRNDLTAIRWALYEFFDDMLR